MALTVNPAWRTWNWVTLHDDVADVTLDVEIRPPTFMDRTRLETLDGDQFVAAMQQIIRACVKDWRDVLDRNGAPVRFTSEALLNALGQYPALGAELARQLAGAQAAQDPREPAKNPTATPGAGPAG